MSGHGHVVPNPNGMMVRCGGPKICAECALELAQHRPLTPAPSSPQGTEISTETDCGWGHNQVLDHLRWWSDVSRVALGRIDIQLAGGRVEEARKTIRDLLDHPGPVAPSLTLVKDAALHSSTGGKNDV